MAYFAFDLLYLDGFDLRKAPLIERKRVLAALLDEARSECFQLSQHEQLVASERTAMGLRDADPSSTTSPFAMRFPW